MKFLDCATSGTIKKFQVVHTDFVIADFTRSDKKKQNNTYIVDNYLRLSAINNAFFMYLQFTW